MKATVAITSQDKGIRLIDTERTYPEEIMGSLSEVLKHRAEREVATRMFQGGETMEYVQKYVHLDTEEFEEECERQPEDEQVRRLAGEE